MHTSTTLEDSLPAPLSLNVGAVKPTLPKPPAAVNIKSQQQQQNDQIAAAIQNVVLNKTQKPEPTASSIFPNLTEAQTAGVNELMMQYFQKVTSGQVFGCDSVFIIRKGNVTSL